MHNELYITTYCQPVQQKPTQIHPLEFQVQKVKGKEETTIKPHSQTSFSLFVSTKQKYVNRSHGF